MNSLLLHPNRVLAIILGASEWPGFNGKLPASKAYGNAADGFREYLEKTIGIDGKNLLPLFDKGLTHTEIDTTIEKFLTRRVKAIGSSDADFGLGDVFVFYTGHGRQTLDGELQLILRSTRDNNRDNSGYRMSHLAQTLNRTVRSFRRWIFLDCCFSGLAHKDLMPNGPPLTKKYSKKDFPAIGTALLAACIGNEVAMNPKDTSLTMFSSALLDVLRNGDGTLGDSMSLEEVSERIIENIQTVHRDKAKIPVLSVPDPSLGDIAKHPFFPNPAKQGNENRTMMKAILDRLDQVIEHQGQSAVLLHSVESIKDQFARQGADLEKRIQEMQARTVKKLRTRLDALVDNSAARLLTIEGCIDDLKERIQRAMALGPSSASTGEKIVIQHYGLDMMVAWTHVEELLKELLKDHLRATNVRYEMLILTDDAASLETNNREVHNWCRNVSIKLPEIEDSLALMKQEHAETFDYQFKRYSAFPIVHGFRLIHPRIKVCYLAFIRWKKDDGFKKIAWGERQYHIIVGDNVDASNSDLLAVFEGHFGHYFLQEENVPSELASENRQARREKTLAKRPQKG